MYMIELPLDAAGLMRFAHTSGHGRDDDFGYTAHAWLAATLGDLAPKPFRLIEGRGGLRMLGYAREGIEALRDHARTFAEPRALRVCDWSSAASKAMPGTWSAGRRLGFELRACPVCRAERERDVYLAAVERSKAGGQPLLGRFEVYLTWLIHRLNAAATPGGAYVDLSGTPCPPVVELLPGAVALGGFRRVRGRRLSRGPGGVKARQVERPDALFTGELTVRDPERFSAMLARGIGRHRAFGFGMLLVRPLRERQKGS